MQYIHICTSEYMYLYVYEEFCLSSNKGLWSLKSSKNCIVRPPFGCTKKLVCRSTNCSTYISTFTGCFLHPTVPKTLLMMTLYLSNQLVNLSTINQTLPSTIVNPSTLVKVQGRKQRFVHRLGAETSTLRLPHYFAP